MFSDNFIIFFRKKLNELHLEQFYSTNIDEMVDLFQKRKNFQVLLNISFFHTLFYNDGFEFFIFFYFLKNDIDSPSSEVVIVQDAQYKRLKSTVNIQNALSCFSNSK